MDASESPHREITDSVIGVFYATYNSLGFGFLESHYATSMERRLRAAGHRVAREYAVRIYDNGHELGFHRLDMVVDDVVVIELKATEALPDFARRQLFNYLRASNLEVGLLLHFGPSPGVRRLYVPKRS
jgi:GxxExxY protein